MVMSVSKQLADTHSSKCDHSGPQMEQQSELEMTRFGPVCCQADEKGAGRILDNLA